MTSTVSGTPFVDARRIIMQNDDHSFSWLLFTASLIHASHARWLIRIVSRTPTLCCEMQPDNHKEERCSWLNAYSFQRLFQGLPLAFLLLLHQEQGVL
jgi:hypothetical protein